METGRPVRRTLDTEQWRHSLESALRSGHPFPTHREEEGFSWPFQEHFQCESEDGQGWVLGLRVKHIPRKTIGEDERDPSRGQLEVQWSYHKMQSAVVLSYPLNVSLCLHGAPSTALRRRP